jgi:putative transcriptional regulator
MAIQVKLDLMLVRRKVTSRALAQHVGITEQNLSLLKSGKVRGVRFETLSAICQYLDCQPGDLLFEDGKATFGSEVSESQ